MNFTFDSEEQAGSEIPSVTKLLNRKSLGLKSNPSETPPSESPVSPPPPVAPPALKVQPAGRKPKSQSSEPLSIWDQSLLEKGSDPLGKGMLILFQKGAQSALFLAVIPGQDPTLPPRFTSTAAVFPKDKLTIWTGLTWDPKLTPEVWNFLIQTGFAEYPPPGASTQQTSNRNVLRAAFGIQGEEWLLLVRVGPKDNCRGVAIFVSKQSIQKDLEQALPLLTSKLQK